MTRSVAAVLVAVVGAAGCGDDGPDGIALAGTEPVTCGSPPAASADAVRVEVQWQGPWDDVAAPAIIQRWDDAADHVDVAVLPQRHFGETVSQLMTDAPPTLARVPMDAVDGLAAADAIRPLDRCVTSGLSADEVVPGADTLGMVGDVRYGVAGNVGVSAMVYDHAALDAAGLAGVPTTWAQLGDLATALREQGPFATPVADVFDTTNLAGSQLDHDVPDAVLAWMDLATGGSLLPVDPHDDLLPVGDGRAVFEVATASRLWAYASALAQGQAPQADVRVAALPGAAGPMTPIFGDVWVISAEATDDEAAAATALLSWLVEPAQQAALHPVTDLFPTSLDAAVEPVAVEYWSRLPLLGEVWALVRQHAVAPPAWSMVPGAVQAVELAVRRSIQDGNLDDAWRTVSDIVNGAAQRSSRALLECAFPSHEQPAPTTSCAGSGT